MDEPIEELYFNWLCAKVLPAHSFNYNGLLMVLHRTEFVWIIPGDDNREEEGLELRIEFLRETNFFRDHDWINSPCSVLEVLIALAKAANFHTDIPVDAWFWTFIRNLGLEDYRRITDSDVPDIQEVLYNFIRRTYEPNGAGGLFPMRSPRYDQRQVELWYQFCEYVQDQALI